MLPLLTLLIAALTLPPGPFDEVEARNGSHVVVRHGAVRRLSLLQGDPRCARVSVSGRRLVIDNPGHDCRHGERALIEVVVPDLTAVAMSNGGSLQTLGAFPDQESINANVEQGGTIDIRSLAAGRVVASVYSGGRILTNPRKTLEATVESGGLVMYWGDVEVARRSVSHGGVVTRGAAEDAGKPLSNLGTN